MQPQHHQFHHFNSYQSRKCFSLFLISGFLCVLIGSVQSDDYLKEAPPFLIPCQLNDPQNSACLARAFENVYTNWKEGIPGIKNLGGIDPFHVKKVHVLQDAQNINLKVDLKDVEISGLSKAKILKASIDSDYNMKFLVKVPSLRSKAKYRMKGSILLLNVDSSGVTESDISDFDVMFSIKTKLIKANNQRFFDISSIQSSIKNIANFHVHFSNLFNGSPELDETANTVFNQNWREIFEIMRPTLEETMNAIALDRYKKIFHYVPANYFLTDLP